MRLNVYIDISNLYYTVQVKYGSKARLNFSELRDYLKGFGVIGILNAYGAQTNNQPDPFILRLRKLGYNPIYKSVKEFKKSDGSCYRKADWDVGIAIDVIRDMDLADAIALGTGDGDFAPLVQYLLDHGKRVIVIGTAISRELRDLTQFCVEIPQSMIIERKRHANAKLPVTVSDHAVQKES